MPVLVVLDPTPNPKLAEMCEAFEAEGGEAFVGLLAWEHLNDLAGPTMAKFLDLYVHAPTQAVMENATLALPPLTVHVKENEIGVNVGAESFVIERDAKSSGDVASQLPDDVDEETGGP